MVEGVRDAPTPADGEGHPNPLLAIFIHTLTSLRELICAWGSSSPPSAYHHSPISIHYSALLSCEVMACRERTEARIVMAGDLAGGHESIDGGCIGTTPRMRQRKKKERNRQCVGRAHNADVTP